MNWSKKRVAVTGAAGFIGSYLCKALVSRGVEVTALDNFDTGAVGALDSILSKIHLLQCDITQESEIDDIRDSDIVFHLAAMASPKGCLANFPKAYRVNVEGTRNVLNSCQAGARVIFMSGAIVYGEPLYMPLDEQHPSRGRDPYSLTKIMGECLCWAMMEIKKIKPTVVRNFTTYGPGQSQDYVIPSLISQGLKEGRIEVWNDKPSRDFTYVEDMVEALIEIAQTPSLVGEVVNLGSGVETPIGKLAHIISQIVGNVSVKSLDKKVVGSVRQACDNTRLRNATGWTPRVSLREGLGKTVEWIRSELDA